MDISEAELCQMLGLKDVEIHLLKKEIMRLKPFEAQYNDLKKIKTPRNGAERFSAINEGEKPKEEP
jgi:hypothetical protein